MKREDAFLREMTNVFLNSAPLMNCFSQVGERVFFPLYENGPSNAGIVCETVVLSHETLHGVSEVSAETMKLTELSWSMMHAGTAVLLSWKLQFLDMLSLG